MNRLLILVSIICLSACQQDTQNNNIGYIENKLIYLSNDEPGYLKVLNAKNGDIKEKDFLLYELDDARLIFQIDSIKNQIKAEKFKMKDMQAGARQEVIKVLETQLAQARENKVIINRDFERKKQLFEKGTVSLGNLEDTESNLNLSRLKIQELEQKIISEKTGERENIIASQQATIDQLKAQRADLEWRRANFQKYLPFAAVIEEIFYEPGEFVKAGEAVVSIYKKDEKKAIFYVGEDDFQSLKLGSIVVLKTRSKSSEKFKATIDFIANEPEFIPPVIYTDTERKRLKFKVEAKVHDAFSLNAGQPIIILLRGNNGSKQ